MISTYKKIWHTHRETGHMKTEAETRVMQLQAWNARITGSHWKLGERDATYSPSDSPPYQPCWHYDLGLLAFQTTSELSFCCFSPPHLWYFDITGPGDEYILCLYFSEDTVQMPVPPKHIPDESSLHSLFLSVNYQGTKHTVYVSPDKLHTACRSRRVFSSSELHTCP